MPRHKHDEATREQEKRQQQTNKKASDSRFTPSEADNDSSFVFTLLFNMLKTRKGQAASVFIVLISIYLFNQLAKQHPIALTRFKKTPFKPCPIIPATISNKAEHITEVAFRDKFYKKIHLDPSLKDTPNNMQSDAVNLKNKLIEYIVNSCDQSLIELVNMPVKLVLTNQIKSGNHYKINRFQDLYAGMENTIYIYIPITKTIAALANSPGPIHGRIIRALRHEGWHARRAAINSDRDCDPAANIRAALNDSDYINPVNIKDFAKVEKLIRMGDQLIITELKKLHQKALENKLSPPEKEKFEEIKEQLKNYIPRRQYAGISQASIGNSVKSQLERGAPWQVNKPDSNIPLFVDEIHNEKMPEGKIILIGSGYHVSNPQDKINALIVDTEWKMERIEKMYQDRLSIYQKNSDAQKRKLLTELEAFTVESGPEVIQYFYPELNEHLQQSKAESLCQPKYY